MSASLSAIYRYPLKSARGHALHTAVMDRFGLAGDRRWMLVDDSGRFQSQRRLPSLALLDAEITEDGLRLRFGERDIQLSTPDPRGPCVLASVWKDTLMCPVAEDAVNAWLSEVLGESLRLVHCPESARRGVDPDYATAGEQLAFADGFPLLLISEASLAGLNERLPAPAPMDRFRPNLVIRDVEAHAEDQWRQIRVGQTPVRVVKPCSRCVIPSIDQQTARRDPHINRALAKYRRRDGAIYFGMNALAPAGARFEVGNPVTLID